MATKTKPGVADTFINQATTIHRGFYSYPKNWLIENHQARIICPSHGEFNQSMYTHLAGTGCKKCRAEKLSVKYRISTKSFVIKASSIHKNKYDYCDVNYTTTREKITIICPSHGKFQQTPSNHLRGQGCPQCGIGKCATNRKMSIDNFKRQAQKIHGDIFSFDKTVYNRSLEKTTVTCKKHGDFLIRPNDLLNGHGCFKCNFSKKEKYIETFLKTNNIEYRNQVKFTNCKDKRSLPFDFGLYNNQKLIGLIEFQGIHHYYPITRTYKDNVHQAANFQYIQNHDLIKRNYCLTNKIPLLEIKYNEPNINKLITTFYTDLK